MRRVLPVPASIWYNPVTRCLVALLLFALSLSGLAATTYADQYTNGGISWDAPAQPVSHSDINPLGVNTFLEKEVDPTKVTRSLDMVRDGGFKWIRQGFSWNDIEINGKGDYTDNRDPSHIHNSWEKYDFIVNEAYKRGVNIIARLDSPPVWARQPGDDVETFRKGPPAHNEDYADFVTAVATRYKGKIKYYQIWNEPNLYGEWGGFPPNAEQFTALLKAGYQAVKKVDPNATVISAALAPTAGEGLRAENDVLFLEEMYQAGAAPYFDILSTMLYGLGQPPDERRTDLKRLNFSRPILLRQVMERNGDARKPIWISEYAWVSLPPTWEADCTRRPPDSPCGANIWGRNVDEQAQGQWEVDGYRRARAEWPWLGVMSVWSLREPDPHPEQPANWFAIVNPDFTPRPAYNALKAYSAELYRANGAPYRYGAGATVTGEQSNGGGPAQAYTQTVSFTGSSLEIAVCGACSATLLSIDGKPVSVGDSALAEGGGTARLLTLAGNVPYGPHTARVLLVRGSTAGAGQSKTALLLESWKPPSKPPWNALGFPFLYAVFGFFTVGSAALGLRGLGRWSEAALNVPQGRFGEASREVARNGALVVGMALLMSLYYRAESLPLILVSLAGVGLLALLKPSTGLAAVAFSIPFYWQPKHVGQQHFPVAETLLVLVFGAVVARRVILRFVPSMAKRLHINEEDLSVSLETAAPAPPLPGISSPPNERTPQPAIASYLHGNTAQPARPLRATINATKLPAREIAPASEAADLDDSPAWPARPRPVSVRYTPPELQHGQWVSRKVTKPIEDQEPDRTQGLFPSWQLSPLPAQGALSDRLLMLGRSVGERDFRTIVARIWSCFLAWNREDAFGAPAVALLLLGTLSLLFLADPSFAGDSARAFRWEIVEPVLFYFLITEVIRGRRSLLRAADFFVAAAVGVALFGLFQYIRNVDVLNVEGVNRIVSVYQHPDNLALYLGRVAPFLVCMAIFLPRGWRKTIYAASLLPIGVALLLTYSRAAWAAVALAIAIALFTAFRWRSGRAVRKITLRAWAVAAVVGGILLVGGAVAYPSLPPRINSLGSGVLRVAIWQTAGHMLADHLVTGIGPDQFLNQFQSIYFDKYYVHFVPDKAQQEPYTAHPHNIVLDYWLSLGIMGVFVLLWLLWRYFREAANRVKEFARRADRVGMALALGLLASMIDFLVHGLVDNSYFLMDLALVFWLSCGLLQVLKAGQPTRDA